MYAEKRHSGIGCNIIYNYFYGKCPEPGSTPAIERDFQTGAAEAGWIITVYMLTCAALTVPFGKIADTGRKNLILRWGIFIFTLACTAAAFSFNMAMLIICRAAQGVGASMIFSTNIAVLVNSEEEKPPWKSAGDMSHAQTMGDFLQDLPWAES